MLKTNIRKIDNFKTYYWHDATLVGKYKLPQLNATRAIPTQVISFNERKSVTKPEKYWVDFFIDDVLFESFWNHPEVSFSNLKQFAGIITPDYSMLPEMLPTQRIWNCTRNRVMAFYLQHQGFNIIPVASWCLKKDFKWCFDGLPYSSSIAISTNGCMSSPYGKRMLLRGIEELQRQKSPTNLIICGRHIAELDTYENIHYCPSFSQRWKERVCNGQ